MNKRARITICVLGALVGISIALPIASASNGSGPPWRDEAQRMSLSGHGAVRFMESETDATDPATGSFTHAYADELSGDEFTVDTTTNRVLSYYNARAYRGASAGSKRVSRDQAEEIASAYVRQRLPHHRLSSMTAAVQTTQVSEEPATFEHVCEWREHINGIPTSNYVRISVDAQTGDVRCVSQDSAEMPTDVTPTVSEDSAVLAASETLRLTAYADSTTELRVIRKAGCEPQLVYTVELRTGRGERSDTGWATVDAHSGQVLNSGFFW